MKPNTQHEKAVFNEKESMELLDRTYEEGIKQGYAKAQEECDLVWIRNDERRKAFAEVKKIIDKCKRINGEWDGYIVLKQEIAKLESKS